MKRRVLDHFVYLVESQGKQPETYKIKFSLVSGRVTDKKSLTVECVFVHHMGMTNILCLIDTEF